MNGDASVERGADLAITALVGVVIVVWAWRALTLDWTAAGDLAVIRLRALDVGTANTPLVGVYSRFGWNHPGPALAYALAPWARLTGSSGVGILVGALVINLCSLGGALWVARRAGRAMFACTAVVLAAFVLLAHSGELFNPWNPYVIVLPLGAAVLAAWGTWRGDRVAAIVLVLSASFAIQGHLGAAPLGLTALAVGAAALVRQMVRPPTGVDPRVVRRTALIAGGVLVVCWIPALLDELFATHNVTRIIDFQLHDAQATAGLRFALEQMTRLLTFPPGRQIGFPVLAGSGPVIPWMALALAMATVVAWRRHWWDRLSLAVIAWLSIVVSTVAIAQLKGIAFPYLMRWAWASAVVVWIACVWVAVSVVAERFDLGRWGGVLARSAIAVLLVAIAVTGVDFESVRGWDASLRAYAPVVEPTLAVLRTAPEPILLTTFLNTVDGTVANELLVRADASGVDVRRTPDLAGVFGRRRVIDPTRAASQIVIVTSQDFALVSDDPRYRLIAEVDPLSPDERVERDALAARFDGREREFVGDPDLRRYHELDERAEVVRVYYSQTPPFID